MRGNVKAPIRPFEYMAWAQSVPAGARYNLTASGMADATETGVDSEAWSDQLSVAELGKRSTAWESVRELSEAVAARYGVEPSQVSLSLGASQAILHTLMALVRAGDHVIVERPTYEALHRVPEILGATVSRIERKFEDGWQVVPERLAQLLTSRTRAVILTNLHNPSGVALDVDTISAVADLAARVGAMVLVDEVYLDYGFSVDTDANVQPVCRVAPNGISWSSSTKAFGMAALRSGWIVSADPDAAKAIRMATDYLHVYPPACSALLGRRVLDRAQVLQQHAASVAQAGRKIVQRWVDAEQRVAWVAPQFGITGLVRLPHLMQDGPFVEHLRARYDTQVVPGSMFDAPGFVRVSYGVEAQTLEQGLANISAALDDM